MLIYIFGIISLERILSTLLFSIPPRKRGIEKIRNISNDEKIRNNSNDEKINLYILVSIITIFFLLLTKKSNSLYL